jgi:hypothetical protein
LRELITPDRNKEHKISDPYLHLRAQGRLSALRGSSEILSPPLEPTLFQLSSSQFPVIWLVSALKHVMVTPRLFLNNREAAPQRHPIFLTEWEEHTTTPNFPHMTKSGRMVILKPDFAIPQTPNIFCGTGLRRMCSSCSFRLWGIYWCQLPLMS